MQAAGERGRLAGDALHHVALAAEREGAVVDDLEAGPVEAGRQHALGERHPDGVGEALAERPGGHLDPRRHPALGMPGRARAPLAELLEVVDREVVAAEMQGGIEEHRRMAAREHEAVAVRPVRVRRIVAQMPGEQAIGKRSQPHGRAGMPRLRALDRVDREEADGVDRIGVDAAGRGHLGCPVNDDQIVAWAVRFGRHEACPPAAPTHDRLGSTRSCLNSRQPSLDRGRSSPSSCARRRAIPASDLRTGGVTESIANTKHAAAALEYLLGIRCF